MVARVLLIEGDAELGGRITEALRGAGLELDWEREAHLFGNGEAAPAALVLLDLQTPGDFGLDVLKSLREHHEIPVIALTSSDELAETLRAFRLGADDVVKKPVALEELVERVRACLRRPFLAVSGAVELGPLRVDLLARQARLAGRVLPLTPIEFELLVALSKRPGAVLSRAWLAERLLDPDGHERTLDVHVSRLRKKLGPGGLVETVRGVGYRLALTQ